MLMIRLQAIQLLTQVAIKPPHLSHPAHIWFNHHQHVQLIVVRAFATKTPTHARAIQMQLYQTVPAHAIRAIHKVEKPVLPIPPAVHAPKIQIVVLVHAIPAHVNASVIIQPKRTVFVLVKPAIP